MKCPKCGREYPDYVETCTLCASKTIPEKRYSQQSGWKCPRCSKLVDDGESKCPYCGFDNLLVDSESERMGIDVSSGWVRSFTVFITTVTIDNGSDQAFVRTKYNLLGFGEEHTYSKTLWLVLNFLAIALFVIGAILFLFISMSVEDGEGFAPLAGAVLVITVIYGLIFYYVTFVPPK